MPVTTSISQIKLDPGSRIALEDIPWREFEALLEELGEKRSTRLAYAKGMLEIMAPPPEHERWKVLIADLVKLILKLQRRDWESLGSTTFKREGMAAGIEPDDCFYIQNYRAAIGKARLDLEIDPPPDLAIESDLTSTTERTAYQLLGVSELWIYGRGQFTIYLLSDGEYVESTDSPTFPGLPISNLVDRLLHQAREIGSSQALLAMEGWLRDRFTC